MSETNDEILKRKCIEIAEHIKDMQICNSHNWRGCEVILNSGIPFHIYTMHGRVEVTGTWPRYGRSQTYYSPGEGAPSISCSITRPSKSIAQDIERRFLPYYIPLWQSLKKRADEATAEQNAAYDLVTELTGSKPYRETHPAEGLRHWPITIKVKSSDGKDVDLELHDLTPELARSVLKLVEEYFGAPPEHEKISTERNPNAYCQTCKRYGDDCTGTIAIDPTFDPESEMPLYDECEQAEKALDAILDARDRRVNLVQNIFGGMKWGYTITGEYPQKVYEPFETKLDAAKAAYNHLKETENNG